MDDANRSLNGERRPGDEHDGEEGSTTCVSNCATFLSLSSSHSLVHSPSDKYLTIFTSSAGFARTWAAS